jgi:hypothetical protein
VALLYNISPHVFCFKDAGYERTAMDLRTLKHTELSSGMNKMEETGRTGTNVGVETLMSTVTDFVVWKARATPFQSLNYSL